MCFGSLHLRRHVGGKNTPFVIFLQCDHAYDNAPPISPSVAGLNVSTCQMDGMPIAWQHAWHEMPPFVSRHFFPARSGRSGNRNTEIVDTLDDDRNNTPSRA